jgi:hypothetical protein
MGTQTLADITAVTSYLSGERVSATAPAA